MKAEVGHVSQLAPQRKSKRGHVWGRYESASRLYYYTARLYNIHHTLRRKFSWKISKNSFEFRKWKFFKCLDPHWWIGANNNDVLSPFYLYHFDNSNQQKKNRVPYMRMIQFIVVMCTLTVFCCYEIENRPAWKKEKWFLYIRFGGCIYLSYTNNLFMSSLRAFKFLRHSLNWLSIEVNWTFFSSDGLPIYT